MVLSTPREHDAGVDEPEREWRIGERLVVHLPDGQRAWVRIVGIEPDGTLKVMPETSVVITSPPI